LSVRSTPRSASVAQRVDRSSSAETRRCVTGSLRQIPEQGERPIGVREFRYHLLQTRASHWLRWHRITSLRNGRPGQCATDLSRQTMARAPWPTAYPYLCVSSTPLMRVDRPRRFRPTRARIRAS
jgi:hypothetical protein